MGQNLVATSPSLGMWRHVVSYKITNASKDAAAFIQNRTAHRLMWHGPLRDIWSACGQNKMRYKGREMSKCTYNYMNNVGCLYSRQV
jgi:hypothetical protein